MIELVAKEVVEGKTPETPEVVEVFKLNGVAYSTAKEWGLHINVGWLWQFKLGGLTRANMWLVETMCGPEAMAALADFKDLDKDQWNQITDLCRAIAFGNSPNESPGKAPGKAAPKKRQPSGKRSSGQSKALTPSRPTSESSTE